MLPPSQLAAMHLGCIHTDTGPHATPEEVAAAFPAPAAYGRIGGTPRIAGFNDQVGDCVPTGCCNVVQRRLARGGNFTPIPNELPLQIYPEVSGYVPGNPTTDQGTDPLRMVAWWKQNAIAGWKLDRYLSINPQDQQSVRRVVTGDGALLILSLMTAQQNQRVLTPDGSVPWGLHCVDNDEDAGGLSGTTSWGEWLGIDWSYFTAGRVLAVYAPVLVAA